MVERAPRSVRLHQIRPLLRAGLTHQQIADRLGMTRSAVRNVLNDPDGSKQKARRERYRRPCPKCHRLMDGSSGHRGRNVPTQCASCAAFEARSKPIEHGTRSGYGRGCHCRPCRDALAASMRQRYAEGKVKTKPNPPERQRAYNALQWALKTGKIAAPDGCERCGAEDRGTHNGGRWIQAHHEDYSKPLDVIFLCVPCHKAVHKEARVAA